jgi:hypothetical protein
MISMYNVSSVTRGFVNTNHDCANFVSLLCAQLSTCYKISSTAHRACHIWTLPSDYKSECMYVCVCVCVSVCVCVCVASTMVEVTLM